MVRSTKKMIGRGKGGFTLIELLMVVAIIGILAAIAMPIYANMQAKARIAQGQSDVATLAEAFGAFAAHCGDVPGTGYPGAGGADQTCAVAVTKTGVDPLRFSVTDANGIASGPFLRTAPTAPTGYSYVYTRSAVANFVVQLVDANNTVVFSKP